MTPTLDTALLCSSRAGSDLGRKSDWLRSFVNWVSSFPYIAGPLRYHINYMPQAGFDPPGAESGNCVWTLLSLYPLSHHGWIQQPVKISTNLDTFLYMFRTRYFNYIFKSPIEKNIVHISNLLKDLFNAPIFVVKYLTASINFIQPVFFLLLQTKSIIGFMCLGLPLQLLSDRKKSFCTSFIIIFNKIIL